MRKGLFVTTALITSMATGLFTGCGSGKKQQTENKNTESQKQEQTQNKNTESQKQEQTENKNTETQKQESSGNATKDINLMASQNWIKDVDKELFGRFENKTGIKVKVSLVPDNEYVTLLGTTLSGGSDAVDLFMHEAGTPMISAGIADIAVDLSGESWVSNLEPWAVSVNTVDGKLLGFNTWGIDYEGILYNRTYFQEQNLSVPTTWKEFMELCEKISALGITPLYEGLNGTWHTQSWVYGLTPQIAKEKSDYIQYLNEGKNNKFSDIACFSQGLGQIQELLSAKNGDKAKYFTNDGKAEDWFGSYTSLQNRECVMMFTYSAYAAELKANGSQDEWGMFPCPLLDNQTAVSNGGGISKFINKNSKNIDACKQLLNFLAESENLETYYEARADLVSAAFKNVKSVKPTTATTDITERSKEMPVTMFIKDVKFWSPDVYKFLQGMSDGSVSPEDFVRKIDEYRATMFDTTEE